ncbi:MAG TPA: nitrilase-related carbon-nitrogen hydrolase, partial [Puia sp.]|nr:nitrilase-related carbon-nitrogen hydrolase [Puia sp.]
LNGNFWWLLWIAPAPVLWTSYKSSPSKAFFVAFLAYLVGRLSWLSYLLSVIPPLLAILFTLLLPLLFGLIVVINRKIILSLKNWTAIFAYPALVVSFEYVLFHITGDGTAGSIAYSQANCLPVIQISSVTGILGIVFIVSLFPSALSWSIFAWQKKSPRTAAIVTCIIFIAVVFVFGFMETNGNDLSKTTRTIGLCSAPESQKYQEWTFNTGKGDSLLKDYEKEIAELSNKEASIIVLPEKIITVSEAQDSSFRQQLSIIAQRYQVYLIVGYTLTKGKSNQNLSWVVSPKGQTIANYQKVNLFEGEAYEGFQRGNSISVFEMDQMRVGTAICKDMDYQSFLRKYGREGIQILFVPAWDFEKDDWLHSRMAILRGVENGFPIARSARMGRLTISNSHGKVLAEASSADGREASVVGRIHISSYKTVYSYWGDWFAVLCLLVTAIFVFISLKRVVS